MAAPPAHVDLWEHRALSVAALGRVGRHAHAAAALLVGIDGMFSIRERGDWRRTRTALIPAGVTHELACGTTLMATLYLFPTTGEASRLAARLGLSEASLRVDFELPAGFTAWLAAVHGGDHDRATTGAGLDALVGGPLRAPALDPRVLQTAQRLQEGLCDPPPMQALAEEVGLSESRLMHLFKAEVGIPVRRFRAWARMRSVTQNVARGDSLTMAALASGFADSAHMSHAFRSMFGIAASTVLNPHSRLRAEG